MSPREPASPHAPSPQRPAVPAPSTLERSWEAYRTEFCLFVVRLSPYFYNTLEDVERAVAALRRHVR